MFAPCSGFVQHFFTPAALIDKALDFLDNGLKQHAFAPANGPDQPPNAEIMLSWTAKRLILLLMFFLPGLLPLQAAVYLCNESADKEAYVAFGYPQDDKIITKGWYLARPGRCVKFSEAGQGHELYYFAYLKDNRQIWSGTKQLCVRTKPFSLENDPAQPDCAAMDAEPKGFQLVDTEAIKFTQVVLSPSKGEKTKSYLYNKAPRHLLEAWAEGGDPQAAQWLRRRDAEEP